MKRRKHGTDRVRAKPRHPDRFGAYSDIDDLNAFDDFDDADDSSDEFEDRLEIKRWWGSGSQGSSRRSRSRTRRNDPSDDGLSSRPRFRSRKRRGPSDDE